MKIKCEIAFEAIIAEENLLAAWREFAAGKGQSREVREFGRSLAEGILQLHADLASGHYRHGGYHAFNISDPKPRHIHKASVRDRVVHHAIHRKLAPWFDRRFIADSYSCRLGKGVHRALDRFRGFARRVGQNHTRTVWVLKCDVRQFFASIDHGVLLGILSGCLADPRVLALLARVVESFAAGRPSQGLPLGNLTSQLFCNIYLNELDQFAKHKLRAKYYMRYADDVVVISHCEPELRRLIPEVAGFLNTRLRLSLHPNKVFVRTLASGVDFLGWVHFPHHRVLRTGTRRRMLKRIQEPGTPLVLQSYLGLLRHGSGYKLKQAMLNSAGLWQRSLHPPSAGGDPPSGRC